jgi:hypothetical protein
MRIGYIYLLAVATDMKDEFAVDENGLTADGYHILPAVSKKSMYVGNLIKFAVMSIAIGLAIHYSNLLFGDYDDFFCGALIAIFAIITVYLIVGPIIFYRRYRYRIDDEKAEIRRGIVTISHTLVPIERIHQVEVSRGPVNRMFGLANVVITTAGGVTTMEYLDESTAESIASKLNETVVKLLKDRD